MINLACDGAVVHLQCVVGRSGLPTAPRIPRNNCTCGILTEDAPALHKSLAPLMADYELPGDGRE